MLFTNAIITIAVICILQRTAGFHHILSVFSPIPYCDVFKYIILPHQANGTIQISYSGIEIPGNPEENLIKKVHQFIAQDYLLPAITVHLHKIIPMGGGLGGGSSNAAFYIKLLNDLAELNLSWGEMHHYAKKTGSDCSFFLINNTHRQHFMTVVLCYIA